jgi:hypothetical protein
MLTPSPAGCQSVDLPDFVHQAFLQLLLTQHRRTAPQRASAPGTPPCRAGCLDHPSAARWRGPRAAGCSWSGSSTAPSPTCPRSSRSRSRGQATKLV